MEQSTLQKSQEPIEFCIFAPSYKRPGNVFTHLSIPMVQYVVAAAEEKAYRDAGINNLFVAPDSAQGNLCRIRNWILDNAPTKNVLIIDDDFVGIGRWETDDEGKKVNRKLAPDEILAFIEHGFCVAEEMGVKFWGLNCIQDPLSCREYTPFALTCYIGGPWQAFLDCDLRYDEELPLKEDYDLTLQVINKYRKVLRFNTYHYFAKQHVNEGGCASYRTISREKEQLQMLQKKWGSRIVRVDSGNSHVKRVKNSAYDINPIIKIPIRGV